MTDDKFFERLRDDAQQLRYEPADSATWTRLQARVAARVREQATPVQLLATWFRPIAAALATLCLIAALSVQWIDQTQQPASLEAMASAPQSDIGDAFSVE